MNPQRIAEAFAALLDPIADVNFTGLPATTGYTSTAVTVPRVVISATFSGLVRSTTVGTSLVSLAIESHAGGSAEDAESAATASEETTAAEAHRTRVELVRAKFFGIDDATATATRSAIAAAIAAVGQIEIDPRYTPMGETGMERNGDRFRTVLKLKCGVFLKPI